MWAASTSLGYSIVNNDQFHNPSGSLQMVEFLSDNTGHGLASCPAHHLHRYDDVHFAHIDTYNHVHIHIDIYINVHNDHINYYNNNNYYYNNRMCSISSILVLVPLGTQQIRTAWDYAPLPPQCAIYQDSTINSKAWTYGVMQEYPRLLEIWIGTVGMARVDAANVKAWSRRISNIRAHQHKS
ncbi:hypothetical protein WR25_00071 [Diploscapter pachys]|uniref:Uncharacterized protein n=1 Tax=Diploscapter pachys TaxID=2018661 RepID=A0A2A2KEF9_9BILA|nr:hypothetical protein WR25_00071 [Diploscapter pachys]